MTSSQKRPPPQKEPCPPVTAMALKQHAFAATVPNMIPRVAAIPKENTSNCVPSFPNLEIKHQGSYPDMPSIVTHPPVSTYTWLGPHLNVSPHRPEFISSPTMFDHTVGVSSGVTAVNPASYESNSQTVSLPVLPRQVQAIPSEGSTVQAAPSPPNPAGKTVSRLPSNDIPRKAPLQGKSHAGISLPRNISRKFPKPKQQRSASQPETPTRVTTSVQKRRQSPNDGHLGTSVQSPDVLPETNRAKKRPRGGREGSLDVEIVEVRKIGSDETEDKRNTTETTSSDRSRNEEEKTHANGPRRRLAKKRATRATSPTQSSYRHRRPLYEYEIPLEVEGIRRALGPDNWDEYMYLLESLWLQKMAAHEFEQGTKPLFQIEYDMIRKKMNSMVVKKMIMPRLEEVRNSLPQNYQVVRGS